MFYSNIVCVIFRVLGFGLGFYRVLGFLGFRVLGFYGLGLIRV